MENSRTLLRDRKPGRPVLHIFLIYARVSLLHGAYTVIRMFLVSFKKIESLIPKEGKILDIGCGNGLFCHYMQLTSEKRTIIGVDNDENRIKTARITANNNPGLQFHHGDANATDLGGIQIITLIDLLHHMPFEAQEKLLADIYDNLKDQGVLIVKDLQKKPTWKYVLHYIHDSLSYKGKKLYFRSNGDMTSLLERLGFQVESHPIDKKNIYPHIVYRCTKKNAA